LALERKHGLTLNIDMTIRLKQWGWQKSQRAPQAEGQKKRELGCMQKPSRKIDFNFNKRFRIGEDIG